MMDIKTKILQILHLNIKFKPLLGDLRHLKDQPTLVTKKGIIVIIEIEGGTDKKRGMDGHRYDTLPICNSLIDIGWCCFPIFYNDNNFNIIKELLTNSNIKAILPRINPSSEDINHISLLKDLYNFLASKNKIILPNPKVMEIMGVKDSLVKISNLSFGRKDTFAYYNIEEWNNNFLSDLHKTNYMNRVIKQNNGSQGEGIWVIEIKDKLHNSIHLDSLLIVQEAKDNIKQELTIKKFMKMCEQYFIPKNGLIVNQAFLPSISKGEIRLLLIGNKIVSIIEKVPKKGGISATLNSGAKYTEYNVDTPKFKKLVDNFSNEIKNIQKALEIENYPLPLIWTADFIEDIERSSYCLGEFNCTCVGIKTVLEKVVPLVANNIDKIIKDFR